MTTPDPEAGGDPSPADDADERERLRAERAARFAAEYADIPLSTPLKVAGIALLAWWALVGWQAVQWWPRDDAPTETATGIARVELDPEGDGVTLRVGEGRDALRFECARPGRSWRVLHAPVLRCDEARGVLIAAGGKSVRVDYDRPAAGGRDILRILALTADGRPLWTRTDSAAAFAWQAGRAMFAGILLLVPGWVAHRLNRAR